MKYNGLSGPLTYHQIGSIVMVILSIIVFVTCIIPSYSLKFKALSIILEACTLILLVVFCLLTTLSNTADPLLDLESTTPQNVEEIVKDIETNMDKYLYCRNCKKIVHKESKHCKACNRCSLEFDHHCKWINNCICKKNYSYFIITLISLLAYSLNFIGWNVYLCIEYGRQTEEYKQRLREAYFCITFQ